MTLLDDVHAHLRENEVPHGLIGAVAVALHGFPRATADTDLLVTSWAVLRPGFWEPLSGKSTTIDVRRGDDDDPLAGAVALTRGTEVVDVVVGRGAWQTALLRRAAGGGDGVPLVRLPDLILLKLHAGGTRDRRDVEDLLPLLSPTDLTAIEAGLEHLSEWSRGHWRRLQAAREEQD